jgi:hypothetical protein
MSDYFGNKWVPVDRDWNEYPIGTKAKAIMGGHWIKKERGWSWNANGPSFPTPGGDNSGEVCLPECKHLNTINGNTFFFIKCIDCGEIITI